MFCEVPRFLLPMSYSIQQKSTTEYLFIAVLLRSELFLDLGFYASCLEHSFFNFCWSRSCMSVGHILSKRIARFYCVQTVNFSIHYQTVFAKLLTNYTAVISVCKLPLFTFQKPSIINLFNFSRSGESLLHVSSMSNAVMTSALTLWEYHCISSKLTVHFSSPLTF